MKKLKTPIELKGRVIKYETKVHLKKVKKSMKGGQYKCADDKKKIKELCVDDVSGEYQDKSECESKCLDKKLKNEFDAWRSLFVWCSENLGENKIYCKGGSALGLEVLKSFLELKLIEFNEQINYTEFVTSNKINLLNSGYFSSKFNEFVKLKYPEFNKLELIKDWDFTVLMSDEQKVEFIKEAQKLGIQNQGQTISILRYEKGLHINEDYLLELSVKTNQLLSDLELPLTNLKFEVNSGNIDLFFQIVEMFVKNDFNFDLMRKKLNQLLNPVLVNGEELVDSITNGFYNITDPSKIDTADLSPKLLELIDNFLQQKNNNNNSNRLNNLAIIQFLITQLIQPDRLFIRFFKKNLEKSKKIIEFYEENKIPIPNWLMNKRVLQRIQRKIDSFLNFLNLYINSNLVIPDELLNPKIDSTKQIKEIFKDFITIMETLFANMNLSRLHTDKIDKEKIEKLLPISVLPRLKDYIIARKNIKNQEDLKKLATKPNALEGRMRALSAEKNNPKSINYSFYLPSGNGKYLEFIRYFL